MNTMAQILNQFGDAYSQRYCWHPEQAKVASCIRRCQTEQMGGYLFHCDHCNRDLTYYCSCRNRHCPHCQRQASVVWQEKQSQSLLPVAYFHLVFTLPHVLNGWVQLHPEVIYRCLFQSVWRTLNQFGQDPKRLNGQLGMTAVLHTWGQTLDQHVHLHCLIPAGAWSEEDQSWHAARSNYLFPVKALSRCYRGKMVSALRQSAQQGLLSRVTAPQEINDTLNLLMRQSWNVFTKACHGEPEHVVDYLSRYTHRIAFSESRLLDVNEEEVVFRWKDYRDGKKKTMRLPGIEFIRRFLLHVLPKGLMRIRHYGFLSNRWRKVKIKKIREQLGKKEGDSEQKVSASKSKDAWSCPHCHIAPLRIVNWIVPVRRSRE
jgi:hypothetical protein